MSPSSTRHRGEVTKPNVYPFTAIVGQDEMKLALLLNAIDPHIGGVLIMGHRGTGKSTAVRGLAELLPPIVVVKNCIYRCDPNDTSNRCADCEARSSSQKKLSKTNLAVNVVELPLGATEDRVCGSIDIQRALSEGMRSFEPGLLARANRGFLYIDEVNLLEDHLVDLLLDVAVTGRNKVERESISVEHPAAFVLIGSGNPEEGELRPQLLDRFGLQVEIVTENDPEQRVKIIERQQLFERDREKFLAKFSEAQEESRRRITRARKLVAAIKIDRALLRKIAELSSELKLDGHRGELTVTRAASAAAALENRRQVSEADVRRVAAMAVRHRLRSEPFDELGSNERIKRALDKVFGSSVAEERSSGGDYSGNGTPSGGKSQTKIESTVAKKQKAAFDAAEDGAVETRAQALEQKLESSNAGRDSDFAELPTRNGVNRRSSAINNRRKASAGLVRNSERGRYTRAVIAPIASRASRIAIDATLRALSSLSLPLSPSHRSTSLVSDALRYKQFSSKRGCLFVLAIDASGSMAQRRINRAREVAVSLLRKAYINRDNVAIVAFRGERADVMLAPSRSMLRAKRTLESLAVGGSTPLSAGVLCALELGTRAQPQHGDVQVILFTDGNANVSLRPVANREQRKTKIQNELRQLGARFKSAGVSLFVVDAQAGFNAGRNAAVVAKSLDARLLTLQ